MNSFYSKEELLTLGLKHFGENVLISRKCSIYSPEKIEIGNNVRIDDFCILSGEISIGNNIHIAAYCGLFAGDAGIKIEDYAGISSRCTLYAISDDYSGRFLIGPCVPEETRNVISKKIILEKYSIIGASSVVLPGVIISEGAAVGANSLLIKSTEEWSIYVGSPAKKIKNRSKDLLMFVEKDDE